MTGKGQHFLPDTAHTWSEDQSSAPAPAQINEVSTAITDKHSVYKHGYYHTSLHQEVANY
jgi:hypothetical protein